MKTIAEKKAYRKAYRQANKQRAAEYYKLYYEDHRAERVAQATAWRKANPESVAATNKRYRERNLEVRKRFAREYQAANKAVCRARVAAWQKANPDKIAAYALNRSKRGQGKLSRGITAVLLQEQGGVCFYCQVSLETTGYHHDHFMPLSKGGLNVDDNIVLACPKCNMTKGAKDPGVFIDALKAGGS